MATSSGSPARPTSAGWWKCSSIQCITSCGSVGSRFSAAKISRRFSVKLAVTMVPGQMVLTRMPSGASDLARFFEMLETADLAAV